MEIFNIDLVAILIFVLPGYYFIAFSGLKFERGLSLAVNSLFFGILLAFAMNYFYPVEKYAALLANPLASAVVLSLWGMVIGYGLGLIISPIRRIFK